MFTKNELERACELVHTQVSPSAQIRWPQLEQFTGCETWVKHENHNPTGAFKVRGGITYIDWLKRKHPKVTNIITATRGNHGQSQALAATKAGITANIYVPIGNSREKNEAMRAYGANLIEFGTDFDEARLEAGRQAQINNWHAVPAFHPELARGVATYAFELFSELTDLDYVYVPIGCGSGICGTIAARNALGLNTKIIGVVSDQALTAKLSFEKRELVETNSAATFADGVAVRVPVKEAFDIYANESERIISVSEKEIADAVRLYFSAIHNIAEGAGAVALAGLLKEKERMAGKKVAVILSGANIDTQKYQALLEGNLPSA